MHAEFPECNVVVRVPSWRIKVNLLCFQFLLVQVSLVLIQTKTNQQVFYYKPSVKETKK